VPARTQLTLLRLGGIRIGVDYSWFFVLFLVIWWLSDDFRDALGADRDSIEPYLLAVVAALAFFASILLHELGHAVVAIRNGIPISDITLWLFGGVARMTKDTESAGTEFRVAIAGPAVTLAITLLLAGLGLALSDGDEFWEAMQIQTQADTSGAVAVLGWLTSINAFVLIFNLIPAFPLDGGRVARAIAWRVTGDRNRATRFAATMGQWFAYGFIAIGIVLLVNGDVVGGIWLGFIGFILAQSARGFVVQSEFSSRIEGIRVEDVMDTEPVAISEETSVERALDEYFLRYRWPWFPVVDGSQRFRGLLERDVADSVPEPSRGSSRIAELVIEGPDGTQVPVDAPLESLLGNTELRRFGGLAAVDGEGRLRGVITAEQVGRALRDAIVQKPEPPPAAP
jgi:Zn-dependent protease